MGQVAHIIDGHTVAIELDGTTEVVKLIGVVTPEASDKNADAAKFGEYATEYLASLLPSGTWVAVEADPAHPLVPGSPRQAYIFRSRDALFVNEQIVIEGYGIAHTKVPFAYAGSLAAAEKKAKAAHKGLWGDNPGRAAAYAKNPNDQPRYIGVGAGKSGSSGWVTVWVLTVW
jgi:micrococcal nuclease